ncbi:11923_t:CDS:2 [Entrophospora sp. SA101]|nr:11923_t:CDS:2 [Entrophospora sp. SA101]
MFYGELELDELASVYGKKYLPDYPLGLIDSVAVQEEWFGFKIVVHSNYQDLAIDDLFSLLYDNYLDKKILFPGDVNNQYDGGPELDSSSSICINEFSSLSILSSSSSALSVEKSGNKKRKISNYFAHSVPLSKQDKEHWEKLVLNSTIDNDWSFRWVDKKSSQILFNFASPGLRLPSCKILAGHILTTSQNQAARDFKETSSLVVSSEKAIQIIFFLNRSVYFMAELHDEQKFKHNKYFALLLPCAICWNSHYHCYSSMLRVKFALKLLVSKYAPSEFEADDNYTGNDDNDRELPLETCRIIANEDWWRDIKKLEKLLWCTQQITNRQMWKEYPDQNLGVRIIISSRKTLANMGATVIIIILHSSS